MTPHSTAIDRARMALERAEAAHATAVRSLQEQMPGSDPYDVLDINRRPVLLDSALQLATGWARLAVVEAGLAPHGELRGSDADR